MSNTLYSTLKIEYRDSHEMASAILPSLGLPGLSVDTPRNGRCNPAALGSLPTRRIGARYERELPRANRAWFSVWTVHFFPIYRKCSAYAEVARRKKDNDE